MGAQIAFASATMSIDGRGGRGNATLMDTAASVAFIDVEKAVGAIDPMYLDTRHAGDAWNGRIHALAWSASDASLYFVVADAFVFWSDDALATLHEVREINRGPDGAVHAHGRQHLSAIVDSMSRTVLVIGRDSHDGPERGVVWRKPAGSRIFDRTIGAEPAWSSTTAGNATAGYFGAPPREMIAVAAYASPAHFWYSLDDGISWHAQSLETTFATHVHEVYLARSANLHRTARLWVSGGDDPSGELSGVVTFDGIDDDGDLVGPHVALRERPGYRLVGLAGDGKHVYIGNESLSGGVLRILDSAQSISLQDFEYVLGKHRHDYHQFRSMTATADGLLAAATDSYAFTGDTIRADSGGFLYVSNDGGASFREVSLGMKWITALVYDGRAFWLAGGMNRESGRDPSALRMTLLRVPKPEPYANLTGPYCAKAVVADSSNFYAMAGHPSHPRPSLAAGERTFRVDLSPYRSIALDVETIGPAMLAVEALPYQSWHPDEDCWRDVATLGTDAAGRLAMMLPPLAVHNRWFRVRNAGDRAIEVRRICFIGRR